MSTKKTTKKKTSSPASRATPAHEVHAAPARRRPAAIPTFSRKILRKKARRRAA